VQIKWLRRALQNLDEEAAYIARENPEAAARLVEQIATSVARLAANPALGRAGRVPTTRELVVSPTPYLIVYRVRSETVEILRIFHGARQWPDQL
jgi:toxin ParE1/3/4